MKKLHICAGAVVAMSLFAASCATETYNNAMKSVTTQTTGVDSQGNIVELGEFFTYGGDNMAAYNAGILGTGTKDPAVCGSFSSAKCSVAHIK